MNPPTLTRTAGVYLLDWPEMSLHFRVDKLTEKSGAVIGEWLIESTNPHEASGHLLLDRINMTNGGARGKTADLLARRMDTLPWTEIIETCCVLVLRAHRMGEPVIDLSKMDPVTRPGFLIDPFVLHQDITMVFGDGDSGKSLFALYLGLLASTGRPDPNTRLQADRPVNVLYLDFERTAEETMLRLQGLCRGLSCAIPPLFYRRCQRRMADEVEEVQRTIADAGIGLVIVDSVGAACGGEIQYAEPVFNYFLALRALHTSIVQIHHITKSERKDPGGHARTPYGSVYLRNYSTSAWEYRRAEGEEGQIIAGLWHDKHNTTKRLPPRAFTISFDQDADQITVRTTEIGSVPEFCVKVALADRIIESLQEGPLPTHEMLESLMASADALRMALHREQKRLEGPRFERTPGKNTLQLCQTDVQV